MKDQWWLDHPQKHRLHPPLVTDLCHYCGHARDRHATAGCVIDKCGCTNTQTGSIYHSC